MHQSDETAQLTLVQFDLNKRWPLFIFHRIKVLHDV